MNKKYGEWAVGETLSSSHAEEYQTHETPEEILCITTHPERGLSYSDPYVGVSVERLVTGEVFLSVADDDEESGEPFSLTYLGQAQTDIELVEICTKMIIDGDHEWPSAIYFHFDIQRFEPLNNDLFPALPDLFWFRCNYQTSEFGGLLEQSLMTRSPVFQAAVSYLQNPQHSKYQHYQSEIFEELSFNWLYRTNKFS